MLDEPRLLEFIESQLRLKTAQLSKHLQAIKGYAPTGLERRDAKPATRRPSEASIGGTVKSAGKGSLARKKSRESLVSQHSRATSSVAAGTGGRQQVFYSVDEPLPSTRSRQSIPSHRSDGVSVASNITGKRSSGGRSLSRGRTPPAVAPLRQPRRSSSRDDTRIVIERRSKIPTPRAGFGSSQSTHRLTLQEQQRQRDAQRSARSQSPQAAVLRKRSRSQPAMQFEAYRRIGTVFSDPTDEFEMIPVSRCDEL